MQSMKATLDRRPQMLRATILDPFVRPGSLKAGFGRDQEVGRIWMQRFCDETLGNYGSIGVGGVDEIDSQLDRAAKDCDRLVMVLRFSPDAIAGELHCAEAEPVNRNVANFKCSARFSRAGVRCRRHCTHIYRSFKRRISFLIKT